MPVVPQPLIDVIAQRFKSIRCGLAVGFPDAKAREALSGVAGGVWHECAAEEELPFDDGQFEVIALDTSAVRPEIVREANRVLYAGGFLFFTVPEKLRNQEGYSAPEIYKLIRGGFDILSTKSPKWWQFRTPKTITVCARKKAWHEHKTFARDGAYIFEPFSRMSERRHVR